MPKQCVLLLVSFLLLCAIQGARGTRRVILEPGKEPSTLEVHQMYRTMVADQSYYDLATAGLLNLSDIPDIFREPHRDAKGNFIKTNFKFDSSKFVGNALGLQYMITLEERVALHLYDDSADLELAAGPQVDQDMCGLHLDYMLMMIKTHLISIRNSTDLSIFKIMHSFDGPNYSIGRGNTIYLGDYDRCMHAQLNVIRSDLSRINKTAADLYFQRQNSDASQTGGGSGILDRLGNFFGPFVGRLPTQRNPLLDRNRNKVSPLGMRFCLAGLRYPEWRNDTYGRRNLNLRVATCLPETCDSRSIEKFNRQIKQLVEFNMKQYYADYYLDSLYCLPDEQSPLRNPFNFTDSVLFICFNAVWIFLVALATVLMFYKTHFEVRECDDWKQSVWWRYLSSWCLTKNYKDLMTVKKVNAVDGGATSERATANGAPASGEKQSSDNQGTRSNEVDLEPLEGFKVLSAIAVITSHACMVIFAYSWNLDHGHQMTSQSWVAAVAVVCPAVVDNFFVATGILTVTQLMQMPRKRLQTGQFWPVFIVYRYLRIVPLYVLVHWFLQTYFRFLGSGPKWDYGTSQTAWTSVCRNESLWTILLPSANLKSPASHCNHVGWYLANDIQFCLLVPIFMMIYLKNYRLGHLTVLISSLAACANHIWYYLTLDADARATFEPSMMHLARVTDEGWYGYVMPQYRCLAFLIGLGAGHVLDKYKRGEIREWPHSFVVGGKLVMAFNLYLLCFIPFISYSLPLENEQLILVLGSVWSGSMHGITSIAAAIFILFLCTGQLPAAAHLLSLDFLKPIAKTSLSTLLVHIPLLYYRSQTMTYLPELSNYHFVTTTFILCVESFALSIAVHLIYEMPLRKILLKIMIGLLIDGSSTGSNNKGQLDSMTANKDATTDSALITGQEKFKNNLKPNSCVEMSDYTSNFSSSNNNSGHSATQN